MSYRLELRKKAEADIDKAFNWYFPKSSVIAEKLIKALDSDFAYLTKIPYSCAVRYKEVRLKPLKHFPICIHYIVSVKHKKVIVLAVMFSPENPKKWDSIQ